MNSKLSSYPTLQLSSYFLLISRIFTLFFLCKFPPLLLILKPQGTSALSSRLAPDFLPVNISKPYTFLSQSTRVFFYQISSFPDGKIIFILETLIARVCLVSVFLSAASTYSANKEIPPSSKFSSVDHLRKHPLHHTFLTSWPSN